MKNKPKQLQQGDTIYIKRSAVPSGAKETGRCKIVVAHGESGHSHVIESDDVIMMEIEGKKFLVNNGDAGAEVLHEEHGKITVDPGIWQVGGVREKDHFADLVKKVTD